MARRLVYRQDSWATHVGFAAVPGLLAGVWERLISSACEEQAAY